MRQNKKIEQISDSTKSDFALGYVSSSMIGQKKFLTQKRGAIVSIVALMAGLSGTSVLAQEGVFVPHIEGELSVEIESDNVFKHDDPAAVIRDSYATIGLAAGFIFSPNFSVQAGFTVEPVDEEPPAGELNFHGHGGYIDTLYAQYEVGNFRLFAGKFGSSFGQAWDLTPGLYGTAFAEDYELAEVVGLGGAVSMEGSPLGNLILSANVFTADTALTKSIFFSRPENRVSGGGVGNTGNLDSYSVTLDGSAIPLLGGQVAWHLGVSSLTKGKEAHIANAAPTDPVFWSLRDSFCGRL